VNDTYYELPPDRRWSEEVMQAVEIYIDQTYRPELKRRCKATYSTNSKVNARVFLEWHHHPDCTFKLNPEQLKEVQKAAGIEDEN
jgi:hypothetical protein